MYIAKGKDKERLRDKKEIQTRREFGAIKDWHIQKEHEGMRNTDKCFGQIERITKESRTDRNNGEKERGGDLWREEKIYGERRRFMEREESRLENIQQCSI